MAALELTVPEQLAKDYMSRVMQDATAKPCDTDGQIITKMPEWYDDAAFKRGQQYIRDNRFGIFRSNMYGLLTLLAEPRGLQMLASTGRSSTAETARTRYVSTVLHVQRWYKLDLAPGSASWASLQRVRRLHLAASNASQRTGGGMITQAELALTTFGFMGFALVRPHLLGIRHDCDVSRAGFVHFWAVMGHTLGVHDAYNMCLLPLAAVEVVCQMLLRYVFVPLIQLESPLFRSMVEALLAGLQPFMPHMTYGAQVFGVRRMCGVPGYQYHVAGTKETLCRALFTEAEATMLRATIFRNVGWEYGELTFGVGVPLIAVHRGGVEVAHGDDLDIADGSSVAPATLDTLHKLLQLNAQDRIAIRIVYPERDGWSTCLNDSKFYQLSERDQNMVRWQIRLLWWYEYRVVRFVLEALLDVGLRCVSKLYGSSSSKTPS